MSLFRLFLHPRARLALPSDPQHPRTQLPTDTDAMAELSPELQGRLEELERDLEVRQLASQ